MSWLVWQHFFVVSDSGRPIFSRYGDEDRLADFMGIIMGLIR